MSPKDRRFRLTSEGRRQRYSQSAILEKHGRYPVSYETANGRSDVQDYIRDLRNADAIDKCRKALRQLAEGTRELRRPFAAPLKGRIWELRVRVVKVQHRFLFTRLASGEYIILVALQKEQSAVPPEDIQRAETRLGDWERRHAT